MKHKILVIGSNSFSGSHFIAHALDERHKVWAVSRSVESKNLFLPYKWPSRNTDKSFRGINNLYFKQLDLNTQLPELIGLIDKVRPSIIVNFAAQGMVAESWLNPTHWYRTNVVSQVALHDALRRRPFLEKYVHVTTPEVYGSSDGGWIKEHTHFAPSTPYAVSRAACDLHLLSFHKAYDFPVVFTRAANVYGPGQQLFRVIPRAMLSARTGQPMQLHGGGHSERSFIHIHDVVRATLQLALEAEPGSTWHISTREAISIRALVESICERCGVSFASVVEESDDRLGKDQSYLLESSALRERFSWRDQVSLSDGLNDTLAWVDANLDLLKTLPWTYQHKA